MHIGIAGPIATADIADLLDTPTTGLPKGYSGAPLIPALIKKLLGNGHQVTAYTLSSDMQLRSEATVTASGQRLRLRYIPMRPKAWPPNGWRPGRIVDLYAMEREGLRRAIVLDQPDVVHAHWAYEFSWAALASKLPHVVTSHDSPFAVARFQRDFKHGGYRWLRAAMAWHVLRRARRVTTVSPYMVEQIQSLCRVPVSVVPNPVTEQVFGLNRTPMQGRQRVLMVGNGWDPRKNGQTALRAFSLLAERHPKVELLVLGHGHGPNEAAQRWWKAQGLAGHVTFAGATNHQGVLDAMTSSDVLLHPSLEESFGVVVAEALCLGLPVVAGQHSGAIPWLVGGFARLLDVTDPAAMADGLLKALVHPDAALIDAGRTATRTRFSPEVVAAAYEREYEAALVDGFSRRSMPAGPSQPVQGT